MSDFSTFGQREAIVSKALDLGIDLNGESAEEIEAMIKRTTRLIDLTPEQLADEYPSLTQYGATLSASGPGRSVDLRRMVTAWIATRDSSERREAGVRVDTREQLEGHIAWAEGRA
jgi:hypothetical protein